MRVRLLAASALAVILTGCSGSDTGEPPPATRATVAPPATPAAPATVDVDVDADADGADPVESAPEVSETTTTLPPLDYSIVFEDLGAGVEGGWITVPLDYGDPQGPTIDLWVTRHRTTSDGRVGVLLANPGGPGVAGSLVAASVRGYFEDPLVERFDIVSWDPRGTGVSGGSVDCIADEEYDRYFASSDITPEDDAERQALVDLARDFAESCVEAVGAEVLPHLGTNNSARDMDAIRQALGEEQVSYLGYSYGSELGAVWATLFPDTVRAAVLDGAAHPDHEGIEPAKQQYLGFERVFDTFLAECSDDPGCAFHNDGDAEAAYDALLAQVDESPIPGPEGRAGANQEVVRLAAIQAMYSDRRWPALERALADAAAGDGSGLVAFSDSYYRTGTADGSVSDTVESLQVISCADESERLTPDEADDRASELIGIAPRLFPFTTASYVCGFFPPSAEPRAEITGERAGPIVVIGTTGDPSTPLASSAAMADSLEEGVLVTVDANQHTAYRTGNCINDVVHEYLIWLEAPAPDTRCP